jgi:hypothetical protein
MALPSYRRTLAAFAGQGVDPSPLAGAESSGHCDSSDIMSLGFEGNSLPEFVLMSLC